MIVLRLVGKKIDIQYLYNRLRALWNPVGRFRMVDLESEVFLASFDDPNDYFHALSGGPWTILGHYLVAFAWDQQFRVTDDLPPRMVVWIRFPRLPYQYYHHDVLVGLGNLIGKTVRPDPCTQNSIRGKFARIVVEVNLAESLPKGVFVDGVWQVVEYENLPSFCIGCGRFGHVQGGCPDRLSAIPPLTLSSATKVHDDAPAPATVAPTMKASSVPAGDWQIVVKKHRRQKKETPIGLNGLQQSKGSRNHNQAYLLPKDNAFPISSKQKEVQKERMAGAAKLTHKDKGLKSLKVGSTSGLKPIQKVNGVTCGFLKPTPSFSDLQASRPISPSIAPPNLIPLVSQSTGDLSSSPGQPLSPVASYSKSLPSCVECITMTSVPIPFSTVFPKLTIPTQATSVPSPSLSGDSAPKVAQVQPLAPFLPQPPAKASLIDSSRNKNATGRTLHSIPRHSKKVTSQSRATKKKSALLAVESECLNFIYAAPRNVLNLESLRPPTAIPCSDVASDPVRAVSDEDFDDSSIEAEDVMGLGGQDNGIPQSV
ncbi:hypothetical protein LINGRAHAP2_LOCUS19537 [Linum grandiflorum]